MKKTLGITLILFIILLGLSHFFDFFNQSTKTTEVTTSTGQSGIPSPMVLNTMDTYPHPLCQHNYVKEENFNLHLYTACSPKSQIEGLKRIKNIPSNKGMLFVYDKELEMKYWMKETYSPLSIAFLDRDFKVVNIAEMLPLDLTPIDSIYPAQYTLELNTGEMKRLGIEEGSILKFSGTEESPSFIDDIRVKDEDYETKLYLEYQGQIKP